MIHTEESAKLNFGSCENKVYDHNDDANKVFPNFYGKIFNKCVLDIGCGTGHLGSFLKRNNNDVYGLTISEEEANEARKKMNEVIVGDIERMDSLPFPNQNFDVIIFADSLEHFANPLKVLQRVMPLLKPDGLLITSIPNIANFKIRMRLLAGNFDYEHEGILDNTHLRFFTLKTARNLITDSGFQVLNIKFTNWNWTFPRIIQQLFFFCEWEIRDRMTRWWPNLFATQFVIYARRDKNAKN